MTKKELMGRLEELLAEKGMTSIDGGNGSIGWAENKSSIQNAINCLEASDETMQDYLTVFKLKYPNSYKAVINSGDWLTHRFNRLYVYNTARMVLA